MLQKHLLEEISRAGGLIFFQDLTFFLTVSEMQHYQQLTKISENSNCPIIPTTVCIYFK